MPPSIALDCQYFHWYNSYSDEDKLRGTSFRACPSVFRCETGPWLKPEHGKVCCIKTQQAGDHKPSLPPCPCTSVTVMDINVEMQKKYGKYRLIVALDVPTQDQAVDLVKELDNVFIFKIGLGLILNGSVTAVIAELQKNRREAGGIFIDLKVGWDIGNTITNFVKVCTELCIKFITVSGPPEFTIKSGVIQTAVDARVGGDYPKILGVPLLSDASIDQTTLSGASTDVEYILQRGGELITAGCDGLIVSGEPIRDCKQAFPGKTIVSPGIRPLGTNSDGHVRFTTPHQAIELGADYLVVGRPILNASDRKEAAQNIIDEIDAALERKFSPVST